MASNPIPTAPHSPPERPLTRDEWWDYILSLSGSAKEMFAGVGGGDAWIRFLREESPEKSED